MMWRAGERPVTLSPSAGADGLDRDAAIDFPSVDAAVERIRDSLVGDDRRGACLSIQLTISPRQALEGTVRAIELPIRRTCPVCGGRGETWTETCAGCGGSGDAVVTHGVRVSVPAGVGDGASFRFVVAPPQAPRTRVELRVAIRGQEPVKPTCLR